MAALTRCNATSAARWRRGLITVILVGWSVAAAPGALAQAQTPQTQDQPSQNPPPEAQPKPPTPGEAKTGVVRPPDVDPAMSKPAPDVDPMMPKPPKPQPPAVPEKQGDDKSAPPGQPR